MYWWGYISKRRSRGDSWITALLGSSVSHIFLMAAQPLNRSCLHQCVSLSLWAAAILTQQRCQSRPISLWNQFLKFTDTRKSGPLIIQGLIESLWWKTVSALTLHETSKKMSIKLRVKLLRKLLEGSLNSQNCLSASHQWLQGDYKSLQCHIGKLLSPISFQTNRNPVQEN